MGVRSYIPQLGRFLQTDPQPGGSANQYAYTYGDPIDNNDLTGEWSIKIAKWVEEANAGWGEREAQAQLAREQAAREEAERLAAQAAAQAAAYAAMQAESANNENYWSEEEWWEEEGSYEYASDHPGAKPESEEAHVEPIALVQSLGETAEGSEGSGSEGGIGVVPLCKTDSEGGCARETGGGGPACPPRFAVCRNYKHRHEVSQREVERVAAEERRLGQDAGCTALGFGVGLAADPVAGAGVGFLCGLL
jgi:hypothetical protein